MDTIQLIVKDYKVENVEGGRDYLEPIYNESLIVKGDFVMDTEPSEAYTNVIVEDSVKKDVDYILIPEKLWKEWSSIYGGISIKRFYRTDPKTKLTSIDIYLKKIRVIVRPMDELIGKEGICTVLMEKKETIKSLEKKIVRILAEQRNSLGEVIPLKKNYKFRLWLLDDISVIDDLDENNDIREIDAKILQDDYLIDNIIKEEINILFEIISKEGKYLFKEIELRKPRYYSHRLDSDIEEYKKANDLLFTKISLRDILSADTNSGKVGILNTENNCYINSSLQCLSHCIELTEYFLLKFYKDEKDIKASLVYKGKLADAYGQLISLLWTSTKATELNSLGLKRQIVAKHSQFRGPTQQDAQEFILHLLNGLHEDLNRVKIPSPIKENREEKLTGEKQWKNYLINNNSIIVDLFAGQIKSSLYCPNCNKILNNYEIFTTLSLPIPETITLRIFFIYINLHRETTYIEINISEFSILDGLKGHLKRILGLNDRSDIVFFTGKDLENLKYIHGSTRCITIQDSLCAYEYQTIKTGSGINDELYFMQVSLRYLKSEKTFSNEVIETDRPIIFAVPKSITIQILRQAIFSRIKSLFRIVHNAKSLNEEYASILQDGILPYTLEITNNRKKSTRFFFITEYDPCEFCGDNPHEENCMFRFSDENNLTLRKLMSLIKDNRDLKLSIYINGDPNLIDKKAVIDVINKSSEVRALVNNPISGLSLQDCLELFSKEEQLEKGNEWKCFYCEKNVRAIKKMTICQLPKILIVHLKRFKQRRKDLKNDSKKVDDFIHYPTNGLDMSGFLQKRNENAVYDLFAVLNHTGRLVGGHYWANCYNPIFERWLLFNDEEVVRLSKKQIVGEQAYVLFYHIITEY